MMRFTYTCNDMPGVQRCLEQDERAGVNWTCFAADAADSGAK